MLSATVFPRRKLSADESASGVNKTRTRSGPSARAHRNATTALSMPPETPTTAPLRRSFLNTRSRMLAAIRSASDAGSIFRMSGDTAEEAFIESLFTHSQPGPDGGNGQAQFRNHVLRRYLPLQKSGEAGNRIQVLRNQFVRFQLDLVLVFHEGHQFQNAGGIEYPLLQKRVVVAQTVFSCQEIILHDEVAYFVLN